MSRPDIKADLEDALKNAARLLKKDDPPQPLDAWLPSGVIRKISDLEARWPYLSPARRKKCACVVQLCDVNRFFLNTFRVGLKAGSMRVWLSALPVIALIETLIREVCVSEGWANDEVQFKKCINLFNSHGLFNEKDKRRIHELREKRNDIHFHISDDAIEIHDGKPKLYNLAVVRLRRVEKLIRKYYEEKSNGASHEEK